MNAHPLPFSSPMVRAQHAGLKTQTRRVITRSWSRCLDLDDPDDIAKALAQCPHGQPGDFLWVREPLRPMLDRVSGVELARYDADDSPVRNERGVVPWPWRARYIASRYCPRWASRTTLELLAVRIERLQSISVDDALAEGIQGHRETTYDGPGGFYIIDDFIELWDSINGKRTDASWSANPFVWVLNFGGAR